MAGITRGSILIGNSSGDPAALAIGTNDHVLTSDGTDIAWEAAGSSGATDIDGLSDATVSSSDPTITTNPSAVGHIWVNKATGLVYVCTSVTNNLNNWVNVGTGSENVAPEYTVDFLVIAGGGGGGEGQSGYGGGGGAGGYRNSYNSETSGGGGSSETALELVMTQQYTITVGAGGAGATVSTADGADGVDSSISGAGLTTITSAGGGGGGSYNGGNGSTNGGGNSGGSGGGEGYNSSAGSGTANQGYDGGVDCSTWVGGGGWRSWWWSWWLRCSYFKNGNIRLYRNNIRLTYSKHRWLRYNISLYSLRYIYSIKLWHITQN
jgi:hypothetical protein